MMMSKKIKSKIQLKKTPFSPKLHVLPRTRQLLVLGARGDLAKHGDARGAGRGGLPGAAPTLCGGGGTLISFWIV
jgi:hypothetical protein